MLSLTCGVDRIARPDHPTASSAEKARQVFSVTELLEHILLEGHPMDVLNFASVNRRAYDIVAGSSVLQRHMNLLPEVHARCFFTYPKLGFTCTMEPKPHGSSLFGGTGIFGTGTSTSDTVVVYATFTPEKLPLRLGRRVRDMFICQPPIHEMRATVSCCNPDKHRSLFQTTHPVSDGMNLPHPIYSETGITVGDIYDACCALIKEHRLCPAAEAHQLDEEGFVKVNPTFRATVQLREDDPFILVQREQEEIQKAVMQKGRDRHEWLTRYVAAKVAGKSSTFLWGRTSLTDVLARDAGEQIPTLAEFEARGTGNGGVDEGSS